MPSLKQNGPLPPVGCFKTMDEVASTRREKKNVKKEKKLSIAKTLGTELTMLLMNSYSNPYPRMEITRFASITNCSSHKTRRIFSALSFRL